MEFANIDTILSKSLPMIRPKKYAPPSRPFSAERIDYGDNHPFDLKLRTKEFHGRKRRKLRAIPRNETRKYMRSKHDVVDDSFIEMVNETEFDSLDHLFEPIRVHFDTSSLMEYLEKLSHEYDLLSHTKLSLLIQDVLPKLADIWKETIKVIPVKGGIYPIKATSSDLHYIHDDIETREWFCPFDQTSGVPNGADLLIFVTVDRHCTTSQGFSNTLASAIACERDQHDRPITGAIDFCLQGMHGISPVNEANLSLNEQFNPIVNTRESKYVGTNNENQKENVAQNVNEDAIKRITSIAVHELTHVLGMTSDSLSYFRHPVTGKPLTPRPFTVSMVKCVDGREGGYYGLPSDSVMKESFGMNGMRHYEIVTPTVRQVVRNQFNCQKMAGARLENQPTSEDCFGSHWDERLFYTEAMGAIHSNTENALSPLTLALLEDSGWYRANYESKYVSLSTFGHGSGCDFVDGPCIQNGKLPSYSKDAFCNSSMVLDDAGKISKKSTQTCSSDRTHKTYCDLADDITKRPLYQSVPKQFQYFEDSNMSPLYFKRADYCPMPFLSPSSCLAVRNSDIKGERYGPNSRCYETNQEYSICLDTICNKELNKLQVMIHNITITCDYDGQMHQLPTLPDDDDDNIVFECPRFTLTCPHLICPMNCAGRGICNFRNEINETSTCSCFDDNDKTVGCTNSSMINPLLNKTSHSEKRRDFAIFSMLMIMLFFVFGFSRYIKARNQVSKK